MALNFKGILSGIRLDAKSGAESTVLGELEVLSATNKLYFHNGSSSSPVVTEAHSQTLTNKSIDADSNTITNIENADIKAGAAIARNKLASGTANRVVVNDGSGVQTDAAAITATRALISDANGIPTHSTVTSTELALLSGLTGDVLTTTNTKTVSNKTLDNSNSLTVQDNNLTLQDNVDNTKQLQFQLSGITTATTRTLTVPDADTTLVGTDATQTLTNKTLTSPTINAINGAAGSALAITAASGQDVNIQGASGQDVLIESLTITDNKIAGASGVPFEIESTLANLAFNTNSSGAIAFNSNGTMTMTVAGGAGEVNVNGYLNVARNIRTQRSDDAASTGTADLPVPLYSFIRVTNASLTTIRSIVAGGNGQKLTLTNATGAIVTVKNEDTGATAADRIITGSGSDLTFRNGASIDLVYDNSSNRWRIVGGPGGSDNLSVTTQTNTNYTALVSDEVILMSCGTTDRTLSLPTAVGNTGKMFYVKKIDAGVGKTIIDANSTETIDGSLTVELVSQHETATLVSDGTNWVLF